MKKLNHFALIISSICAMIIFTSLLLYTDISFAQGNDETITIPTQFQFQEFTEEINNQTSVSSIDLSLPSESWNITNIQLNISDIKLGEEVKTVEDKGQTIKTIYSKGKLGYGVEINITEPTILFGAYIYGYITGLPTLPVYVQIQGYNIGTDAPDENILTTTSINMSIPGWHLQTFEEEVSLNPGSYYLVINGSELTFPGSLRQASKGLKGRGRKQKLSSSSSSSLDLLWPRSFLRISSRHICSKCVFSSSKSLT